MKDFLSGKKHIHFIGIGGSGMYPLAQILYSKGYYITGSDNNETETLKAVRKMGINVFLGHSPENIVGADLIIHTAAIMSDNPELIASHESGAVVKERSELLGLITSWYSDAVCVTGTHGKTTVTSMLTHLFLAADKDISAFIGGKLKLIEGSARLGKSDIMVCEACEFNDTFLKLYPNTTIILNIDEDHLNYFKTMDNLRASFTKFCDMTTDTLIYNGEDENTLTSVNNSGFKGNKYTFGWTDKCNFYPVNIKKVTDFQTDFTLYRDGEKVADISIHVPGKHNVLNAVAACAGAISLGCDIESLNRGFKDFWGAGRRFERLYDCDGIVVVDDYAHHPAEIEATLKSAKEMKYKRIWAIHQPFTFSRTATLLDEFASVLNIADKVILTEIMGSREKNTYNIYSSDLAKKINSSIIIDEFEKIADYIIDNVQSGDMVITLGCGDIYKAAFMIADRLKANK